MPTDYACQYAAECAAANVSSLHAFLGPGHPLGGERGSVDDWRMGASALLVILSGLQADTASELTHWHARICGRIHEALGLRVAEVAGPGTARQPRGWEAVAALQNKARELLTDLAGPGRLGRPGEFSKQLELVEDAFAGALRRMAVPGETSVRCAAALTEAAASLFGLRPSPPPRSASPPSTGSTVTEPPIQPDWRMSFPV